MFRAVAVSCDTELQSCSRSLLGWPSVSSLAVKETQATDKLQEETAVMLRKCQAVLLFMERYGYGCEL